MGCFTGKYRILIVEDDEAIGKMIAMLSKEYIEKVYGINDDYTMPVKAKYRWK